MKTIILILMLTVSALVGSMARYMEPALPTPISVQAPTERLIKEEVKIERKQRQYEQAGQIAARVYRRLGCRTVYADATGRIATDLGLSPRLLAGLVFVESSCNPNATDHRGSIGLTQVNTKTWKYTKNQLKDPETNLRIGASILSTYIHRYGLVEGLHAYNGFGNHTEEYSTKVLTAAGVVVS